MKVYNEAEAMAIIRHIAEENPKYRDRDLDALWEVGEVDCETVFSGYLWQVVEAEVPEMDEDTNTLLADAIIDYFCDQMDIGE